MRRSIVLLGCVLACAAPACAAQAAPGTTRAGTSSSSSSGSHSKSSNPDAPIPVPESSVPPAGRRLSSDQVLAIVDRVPKLRVVRAEYRGSYGGAYLKPGLRWQVSYFSKNGKQEIGQAIVDDITGRVIEAWTGFQVQWTMARGYNGAFGRHVNALYIWLPLCALFLVPFFDFRRPLSLLNLDLLVLLSFSVSLAFFNHARIHSSVPWSYPPLLYLLARMLALLRRGRAGTAAPRRLRLLVPVPWLALGVVFLLGFRVALNVTDSNVIDVGYAGVIGAQRIANGEPLYGHYPADNERGDTYGPVAYEAYVPFQQIFGWSGTWDDLPAAHAAAILFDLLAVGLLFLIGRRLRGPTLGVALAYGWVSYPFTLFALESNTNDTLVAVLVLGALLAASYRSSLASGATGALAALAGLAKFAPLALAPLLATDSLRGVRVGRRPIRYAAFPIGFVLVGALAAIPAVAHDSLHTIYERTIVYQANRASPFSIWGLYGWRGAEHVVQGAAAALALFLALVPRRQDLVGLAAACAAVLIASQLAIEHWFYLYIPWFFPLVLLALLGRFSFGDPSGEPAAVASGPARASRPEAVLSS